MTASGNKGATLVEVIVVSIIVAVLAGAGYSLFLMYTRETRESSAMLQLQFQMESALEEIARRTRSASFVLMDGEGLPPANCNALPDVTTQTVFLHSRTDAAGGTDIFAGFQFDNGVLQEWVNDGWQDFMIGDRTVQVVENECSFTLSGCRERIQVDMTVTMTDVETFTLQSRGGFFLCRN